MSSIEMCYIASAVISLVSIDIFLVVIIDYLKSKRQTKRRAKSQRIANRANRHCEMEAYNRSIKEILK